MSFGTIVGLGLVVVAVAFVIGILLMRDLPRRGDRGDRADIDASRGYYPGTWADTTDSRHSDPAADGDWESDRGSDAGTDGDSDGGGSDGGGDGGSDGGGGDGGGGGDSGGSSD